jgi:hypothetical protein
MSGIYFFSAFGTFGNPNGFRQSYFLGGNADVAKNIKTFDLKTDAVKLFPGSKIYGMRIEPAGSSYLISYTVYTFAKEQNSQRGGTFIGSSLIFVDKIAPESLTIDVLDEFHEYLEKHNVTDGTITINHSDKFSIHQPKDYDKIGFNAREVESPGIAQSGNYYLMVYSEPDSSQMSSLFNKSVGLLSMYDMIYFTESREVAEFVQQKGIFKIVDLNGFEREIQRSEEEKSKLVTACIQDMEKEKENLKGDRKTIIDEVEKQITQNERRHQENEKKISESKAGINVINNGFDQYAAKIDELVGVLKSGGKVEAVRKQHLESRKMFSDKIKVNRDLGSINSMASPYQGNQGNLNPKPKNGLEDFNRGNSNHANQGTRLNGYKIAFWSLLILLSAAAACYLVFWDNGKILGSLSEEPVVAVENHSADTVNVVHAEEVPSVVQTINLNPFPNAELNENDWRLVAKKAPSRIKIDSLINLIYKENPSTVKDFYKHQKKDYKAYLYSLNQQNFTIYGQDTILTDTLRRIPNYIKP